jgi:hypothetical protein
MLCSFTMLRMRGEDSAPLLFRAAAHLTVLNSPYGAAEPILRLRGNRVEISLQIRVACLRIACGGDEIDR